MADGAIEVSQDQDGYEAVEKTPASWQQFWQKEKDAADKRIRVFHKQGNEITRRYLDERVDGTSTLYTAGYRGVQPQRLNLFHTNITTLQSMLFGSTPKIEVAREFHDPDDDQARVAALILQRILEVDIRPSGDDLSSVLKAALQDRLLPGIGNARVVYDFQAEKTDLTDIESGETTTTEKVVDETCKIQYVHWQDQLWGWGRTYSEIPWWGFRAWLTKDEATTRFGEKTAGELVYKQQLPSGTESKDNTYETDQKNNIEKAEIWEFWNKQDKKVYWYSEGVDVILDSKDDPLQLDGFFPCPRPMVANPTTTLFMPRGDFLIAQDLYNEIDELHSRITTITKAVKVIGVYDKNEVDSVGRMFKEGVENDMIPVDNWAMFAEKGGLQGGVDWFPTDMVVGVLQTLIQIRDQTIELLYEVTGMSDILRGANTDQYTSDGTNQLKAKFGSIRVQALQDEFARFASDLDSLKAEVVSKHFTPESIFKQSNAQFLSTPDQQLIQPAIGLIKSPELLWRVNIRPESVALVDYASLKAERTEFLMAMATYIQSAQAAAKTMPGSTPILLEMMKWGMSGFKGANYLEGIMDSAINQANKAAEEEANNPKPDPEQQAMQQAMQLEQTKHQNAMQLLQAKGQGEMQTFQAKMQAEQQGQQQDFQIKMQELQADHRADMEKIQADLHADLRVIAAKLDADLDVEGAQATYNAAEREVEHNYASVEQSQEHRHNLTEEAQRAANAPDPASGGDNG